MGIFIINQTDIFYICIDFVYNMNLQQLEYIVAVNKHKHFVKAAEACFVTQATLSMMVKKLEEELGVVIFNRQTSPVSTTAAGLLMVKQAQTILAEVQNLKDLATDQSLAITGTLNLGIIPTLAPYLLPLVLPKLANENPKLHIKIYELTTHQITHALHDGSLDIGILATPLGVEHLHEVPLFNEPFMVFVNKTEKQLNKKYVMPADLDTRRLWLLEEGHCMRNQVVNLCELKKKERTEKNLEYEAGSIETLMKLIEVNNGITIVPFLATIGFAPDLRKQLRLFKPPVPAREISLVHHKTYRRKGIINMLQNAIKSGVEQHLKAQETTVIDIAD